VKLKYDAYILFGFWYMYIVQFVLIKYMHITSSAFSRKHKYYMHSTVFIFKYFYNSHYLAYTNKRLLVFSLQLHILDTHFGKTI
jgi:hypothetical protein